MEQIKLDLIPGKSAPVCHASQYDVGRTIRLDLVEGGSEYSIPSGTTAEIRIRKPDNNIISAAVTATQGNKYIDIVTAEQWTACAGTNLCEIVLTNGGNVIGTINFILEVEMDPIDGGSASESVIYNIQALVDTAVALHTFLIHITETTMTESAADILNAINSNKILQVIYKPDANSLTTHILPLTLDSGARPDGIRALAFAGFWGSKLYAADIVLDSIHSTVASLSTTNGKDLGDFPIHIHNSTITETAGEVIDAMADGLKPYVIWTNSSQSNYTFTYVLSAVWNPDATTETLIFGCPITGAVRTIHVYINPTTRTYSSSIQVVDYTIPQIDDSSTSLNKVWSAQKINSELADKAEIDDTAVSSSTAWSSERIVSLLPTESASGAVASFETPLTLPLVSHIVTIEPVQAGTGDPSPSNPRAISGWSAVNVTRTDINIWGGQKLADDIVSLVMDAVIDTTLKRVTYTGQKINNVVLFNKFKPNTSYTFFISAVSGVSNLKFYYTDNTSQMINDSGVTVSNSGKSVSYIGGSWNTGTTVLNYEECGILEGELTVDDFEPYAGESVEIDLGGTIYGGKLDVANGVLRKTFCEPKIYSSGWYEQGTAQDGGTVFAHDATGKKPSATGLCDKLKTSNASSWSRVVKGEIMFNHSQAVVFVNVDGATTTQDVNTFMSNVQLIYELATPVEITITPEQINTLEGANNIWADTGDTAVEFKQDIQTYIDSRLSSGTRSLSLVKAPVEEETKQEEQEGDESLTR